MEGGPCLVLVSRFPEPLHLLVVSGLKSPPGVPRAPLDVLTVPALLSCPLWLAPPGDTALSLLAHQSAPDGCLALAGKGTSVSERMAPLSYHSSLVAGVGSVHTRLPWSLVSCHPARPPGGRGLWAVCGSCPRSMLVPCTVPHVPPGGRVACPTAPRPQRASIQMTNMYRVCVVGNGNQNKSGEAPADPSCFPKRDSDLSSSL